MELRTKAGHFIGTLEGGILKKRIRGSKHIFRKVGENGAIGMDYDVLYNLQDDVRIQVRDMETNTVYMTHAAFFRKQGTILHFRQDTTDHYTQVFLPLEMWDHTV